MCPPPPLISWLPPRVEVDDWFLHDFEAGALLFRRRKKESTRQFHSTAEKSWAALRKKCVVASVEHMCAAFESTVLLNFLCQTSKQSCLTCIEVTLSCLLRRSTIRRRGNGQLASTIGTGFDSHWRGESMSTAKFHSTFVDTSAACAGANWRRIQQNC